MCTDFDTCRDCAGPPPAEGETGFEGCFAVAHEKYYVSEYYSIRGVD